MSDQLPDLFIMDGKEYAICGTNGKGVFSPSDYSLIPVYGAFFACRRGYLCTYELHDRALLLSELRIILGNFYGGEVVRIAGPELCGVFPLESKGGHTPFNNYYQGLGIHVEFTGGMLLGRDQPSQPHSLELNHPACNYQTVFEVLFEGGQMAYKIDLSRQVKEFRRQLLGGLFGISAKPSENAVEEWSRKTFKLAY